MRLRACLLLILLFVASGCQRNPRGQPGNGVAPTATMVDGVEIKRDLTYRQVDGIDLALDVYSPAERPSDLPGLLLIHGGGWATGTKDTSTPGAVRLAQQGFVVFAIDYRLAPPGGRWSAPAQIEDSRAALLWARANGKRFGTDVNNIGAIGPSAGGNLALLLGTTGKAGSDKADAVASFSGPTDLTDSDAPIFERQTEILINYLGCPIGRCAGLAQAMSPLVQAGPDDAPAFLANSEEEMVPLEQATSFTSKLQAAGVDVELIRYPGVAHGTGLIPRAAPQAVRFLQEHLR